MRKLRWLLALMIPLVIVSCQKETNEDLAGEEVTGKDETGNGAPSGSHYNLNIIGVSNPKTAVMDGSNGHTIFVKLEGNSKIYLIESTDGTFKVLDANGTDQNGASFMLPAADDDGQCFECPDGDGVTTYSVYARALGKPGGEMLIRNCAQDASDGSLECEDWADSDNVLTLSSTGRPSKFTNVTKQLLYIYVDITDDGVFNPQLFPIFDEDLFGYYWEVSNDNLRLAQLRFYPISTDINATQ